MKEPMYVIVNASEGIRNTARREFEESLDLLGQLSFEVDIPSYLDDENPDSYFYWEEVAQDIKEFLEGV